MSINQFRLLDILTSETLNAKKAELLRAGSVLFTFVLPGPSTELDTK